MIRPAVTNIFKNRIRKQKHILLHNANALVDGSLRDIPDIVSINVNGAAAHVIKSGNQLTQSALAAAGRADANSSEKLESLRIGLTKVEMYRVKVIKSR